MPPRQNTKSSRLVIRSLVCGFIAYSVFLFAPVCLAQFADASRVNVGVVIDEADGALAKKYSGERS